MFRAVVPSRAKFSCMFTSFMAVSMIKKALVLIILILLTQKLNLLVKSL